MKKSELTILIFIFLLVTAMEKAAAYPVWLTYGDTKRLLNQFHTILPHGALARLINAPSGIISPAGVCGGSSGGDNTFRERISASNSLGPIASVFDGSHPKGYVHIRFVNIANLPLVPHRGAIPWSAEPHGPGSDYLNLAPLGLYFRIEPPGPPDATSLSRHLRARHLSRFSIRRMGINDALP